MVNISGVATTGPSKYNLDSIEILDAFPEKVRLFLARILNTKQVMYDWGQHQFFACSVVFSADYAKGLILKAGTEDPVTDDQWAACDPNELHNLLRKVFEGEWGPTSVDTILRMERSGVKVTLCGTSNACPEDPESFMNDLRKNLNG